MRLTIPLAVGAALMLSAPSFAQDRKGDASTAGQGSKQTPAAAASSEVTIQLKVTGMT